MILAKILFSGYLWEACNMDHKDFILESYEVVEIYIQKLSSLQKKIKNQRSEISLCLNRVNKISKILKERVLIKKKLRALKNLKSYKKDLFLKTKNVDEIFYVDRNRQKNYIKLINNMNFIERIQCMKKDREKMIIQCSQNMLIVQKII